MFVCFCFFPWLHRILFYTYRNYYSATDSLLLLYFSDPANSRYLSLSNFWSPSSEWDHYALLGFSCSTLIESAFRQKAGEILQCTLFPFLHTSQSWPVSKNSWFMYFVSFILVYSWRASPLPVISTGKEVMFYLILDPLRSF